MLQELPGTHREIYEQPPGRCYLRTLGAGPHDAARVWPGERVLDVACGTGVVG
jgi:hypothetical protein